MKRSILSVLVAAIAFFAITASASAHVVTVASGDLTCTGVTVGWTSFPSGPFDLNLAFQDQINGKDVASPYIVAHLSGPSGSKFIPAPAASGVTFRKLTGTWTPDGGGSFTVSAWVKCATEMPPPPPTGTTVTVTTPGRTVTTPGETVTTPGQTTTTPGVTTPGSTTPGQTTTVTNTITVTTPAVTVTMPGVTTPGATRTIIKRGKPPKPKIIYRNSSVKVICPKGWNGSYTLPIGHPGKPIVARCSQGKQGTKGAGVTG